MRAADTEQFRALSAKVTTAITEKRRGFDQWQAQQEEWRDQVEEWTERYFQCGVAFYRQTTAQWIANQNYASFPAYFQALADAAGRPLVYAVENSDNDITLRVPKATHKNLVSCLLMVAATGRQDPRKFPKWNRNAAIHALSRLGDVVICDTPQVWWFYFHGAGGREHFNNFIQQCHTNPVFRVALKLSNANLLR